MSRVPTSEFDQFIIRASSTPIRGSQTPLATPHRGQRVAGQRRAQGHRCRFRLGRGGLTRVAIADQARTGQSDQGDTKRELEPDRERVGQGE